MELSLLLEHLSQKKIKLSLNEDQTGLLIRAVKGSLDDDEKLAIRNNKKEIIEILKANLELQLEQQTNTNNQDSKPVFSPNNFTAFNPAQQSIFFHNREILEEKNTRLSPYSLAIAFEAETLLNIEPINLTLQTLINYHPDLHSKITEQEGLVGLITLSNKLTAQQHSVNSISCAFELIQQLSINSSECSAIFNCHLIQIEDESKSILYIYIHHLICDIQLAHILLDNFISIYNNEEIQYEKSLINTEQNEIKSQHNSSHIENIPAAIEADIFYNGIQSSNHYQPAFKNSIHQSSQDIQRLCLDLDCNVFELFFSSFCLSLFKYTQQDCFHIDFAKASDQSYLSNKLGIQHRRAYVDFTDAINFNDIIKHCRQAILKSISVVDFDSQQQQDNKKHYRPIVFSFNQNTFNASITLQGTQLKLLDLHQEWTQSEHLTASQNQRKDLALWPLLIAIDYQGHQQTIRSQASNEVNFAYHQQLATFINHIIDTLLIGKTQLNQISLLKPELKQALIKHYQNNFDESLISEKLIHQYFEQQVELYPHRLATQDSLQTLSYQQLNQQANQLSQIILTAITASNIESSNELIKLPVQSSPYIGIMLDRSNQLIITLLAILKAGFAYLPINKSFTISQQQHIISEAIPQLIIHDGIDNQLDELCNISSYKFKSINISKQKFTENITNNPIPNNDKDNNAESIKPFNLLYTSGTTGRAKGIRMSHKAMLAHLLWMQKELSIDQHSNILHKTPIGFDVSIWEIFLPLISGTKLTVLDENAHKDPRAILACISQHKITLCHFVPSMLEAFVQWYSYENTINSNEHHALEKLVCSGERLNLKLAQDSQIIFSNCEIYNFYGPTECAIDVSQCNVSKLLMHRPLETQLTQDAPIGTAVSNTDLYITDPHGQLSAFGAKGELHIASIQLASAYLNSNEKNLEAFTDNPYFLEGSYWPRIYKTGDIVTLSEQYSLSFHGRLDEQIKLRGQRFELASLNYLLQEKLQLPLICCLLSADKQFINAYYSGVLNLSQSEINEFLSEFIAQDFIPKQWISVSDWPLSNNGKLDKQALLRLLPENNIDKLIAQEIELLNENQKALLEFKKNIKNTENSAILLSIFEQHLSDNLILNRSFIEQGGHSLLALSICQSIHRQTQQHISVQCFFVHESLSCLLYFILDGINQSKQYNSNYNKNFDITSTSTETLAILSAPSEFNALGFSQQSIASFEALKTGSNQYHLPIAFHGTLNAASQEQFFNALKLTCANVVSHHPALQCIYPGFNHQHRLPFSTIKQLILKPETLKNTELLAAVSHTQLNKEKELSESSIAALIQQDQLGHLQIDRQLPLRLSIFQSSSEYLIIITLHHIAVDAVSINLLANEFQTLISEYCKQGQSLQIQKELFEKKTQVQQSELNSTVFDYAYSQQINHDSHQQYWLSLLEKIEPYCNLPGKKNISSSSYATTASINESLGKDNSNSIFSAAGKISISAQQILLSSFQLLLHTITGQHSLAIATAINGRPDSLQNCVGMMVNTIPACSIFDENQTLENYLKFQAEHFEQAIQHQHISLEALANQLKISRELNQLPFAQIGFNLLGLRPAENLDIATNLSTLNAIEFSKPTIKNELTLTAIISKSEISLLFEYSTAHFDQEQVQQLSRQYKNLLSSIIQAIISEQSQKIKLSDLDTNDLFKPDKTTNKVDDNIKTLAASATQTDIYLDDFILHNGIKNHIGFITRSTTPLKPMLWQQAMFDCYRHFDALRAKANLNKNNLNFTITSENKNEFEQTFCCYDKTTEIETEQSKLFIETEILNKSFKANDLLWRSALMSFQDNHSIFIMAVHHALLDGISLEIIGRFIKNCYQRLLEQEADDLIVSDTNTETVPLVRGSIISDDNYLSTLNQLQSLVTHYNPLTTTVTDLHTNYMDNNHELVVKPARLADLSHIHFSFSQQQWQEIQIACRTLRTTPPQYFKTLFALCIKAYHLATNDIVFFEVVNGRDKQTLLYTGVLFQQNINLLTENISFNHSFSDCLKHFSQWRKKIKALADFSPSQLKKIFPELTPYLFNFYIMETATDFLGGKEQVSHIQPEISGAINLITSLIDESLSLDLYYPAQHLNSSTIEGDKFLSYFIQANQLLLTCDDMKTIQTSSLFPFVDSFKNDKTSIKQPFSTIDYSLINNPIKSKPINIELPSIILDDLEERIISIWQQVLQIENITLDSNFFELGGHSLLAIELAQQLQLQCGIYIDILSLLSQPTVSGLINTIVSGQSRVNALPQPMKSSFDQQQFLPLSFNQKRLWLLDKINPTLSSEFVMRVAFSLENIIIDDLAKAIVYCLNSDPNYQLTLTPSHQQTLNAFNESDIEYSATSVESFRQKIQSSKLSLSQYDVQAKHHLMRIFINHKQSTSIQLAFVIHHFIADAKTLELLANDLMQAYQKIQLGLLPEKSHSQLNYLDFINYQESVRNEAVYQHAIDYWLALLSPLDYQQTFKSKQLDSITTVEDTDFSLPTPLNQSASYQLHLPESLLEPLQQYAAHSNVSLFTLLITAYGQAISALSNKRKCPIALARDGRSHIDFANSAGFYTNIIIFDYDNQKQQTLESFLRGNQSQLLDSYRYDFIDIEDISNALKLPRDLKHLPYAQFAFNFIQTHTEPLKTAQPFIDNFSIKAIQLEKQIAQFECLLNVHITNNTIQAEFEYQCSEFDETDIHQLSTYFIKTLELVCETKIADPAANTFKLTTAELLSITRPPQHQQASNTSIYIDKKYSDKYLAEAEAFDFLNAFSHSIKQYPDKVAVTFGVMSGSASYSCTEQNKLTYLELDRLSSQLANKLNAIQDPQTKCLIVLNNCPELIISLLACWKSNTLYSLIDAKQDNALIVDKHRQLQSNIIIANANLLLALQQDKQIDSSLYYGICADEEFSEILHHENSNEFNSQSSDINAKDNNSAYIVFTSGTTGKPKAISIGKKSFQRLLYWYIDELNLLESDSTLIFSSPQFDLTQKNYFALLAVGGCIELSSESFNPILLSQRLLANNYAYINCAPSAIYPILSVANSALTAIPTNIVLGGETIDTVHLATVCASNNYHGDIINTYGPSECTDIVSFIRITQEKLLSLANTNQEIPLGQVLPFSEIYLLDDDLKILPAGFTGQLAIAGKQLANTLDNNRMIANHLSTSSDHLYLSGDMAMLDLDDNQLYYLGRDDQEIKILGQRIQLNTVKQAFYTCFNVKKIELVAHDNTLFAFVDNETYQTIKPNWRKSLSQLLAQISIPSQLIPIQQWPLSLHGKSNQQALIHIARLHMEQHLTEQSPKNNNLYKALTETEIGYLKLIEASLPESVNDMNDNYFMLGGNSLSAIQLCQTVASELKLSLNPSDIFLHPEIHCIIEQLQTLALLESGNEAFIQLNHYAKDTNDNDTIIVGFPALGFSPFSFSQVAKSYSKASFYAINYNAIDFSDDTALVESCKKIIATEIIGNKSKPTNIILMGHSIGGTLAAQTFITIQKEYTNKKGAALNFSQLILLDAFTATKFWPKTLHSQSAQMLLGEYWQNILQQEGHQVIYDCYEYFRSIALDAYGSLNVGSSAEVTLVEASPNNLPEKLLPIKKTLQKSWKQIFPKIVIKQSSATHLRLLHEDSETLKTVINTKK